MLGLRASSPPIFLSAKSLPQSPILPLKCPNFPTPLFKISQLQFPKRFRVYAQNGIKNNDPLPENSTNNGGKGEDDKVKNGLPKFNLNWVDLVLDPNPDNIVAVGLTGLLTWASVQVLWQLFVISGAILFAAVKYTIVAALLLFILITLL